MKHIVKIGTRGSQLALWQTHHVAAHLNTAGIPTEVVVIDTKGDKNLSQSFAQIGTKGIFTQEIEEKLLSGDIHLAVHSAKDLQSNLPEGLEICAFLERENAADVLVSQNPEINLTNFSNYIIGTSSARRRGLLNYYYPGVRLTESRGNLQTRIRKMEEGAYDALILAFAGVQRMGYQSLIRGIFPLAQFTPAVAQGSIAVECASTIDPDLKTSIRDCLNHQITEQCLLAERAFLRRLEGGCSIPIFCYAKMNGETLHLEGGITNPKGTSILRNNLSGNPQEGIALGTALGQKVLEQGGLEILEEIKNRETDAA